MHWKFGLDRKPSTKRLATVNKGFVKFLHGYLYLRFTPEYIDFLEKTKRCLGTFKNRIPHSLDEAASRWYSQSHHSKVLTAGQARDLVTLDKEVHVDELEQVLPFDKALSVILENPGQIAVTDCPCRELAPNPCTPVDVCLIVGEPLVSFVLEHGIRGARKISQKQAAELLEGERARGRVHTAWFKDALGNRFYAICNCCRCCCVGLKAYQDYGVDVVVSSGYTVTVNDDCNGCGRCLDACFFGALELGNGQSIEEIRTDASACMGCGLCVDSCEQEALVLERNANKPAPLEIKKI